MARLDDRQVAANAWVLSFSAPAELTRYMIQKGSVAVDGVSLTINQCDADGFQVSIIPHTAKMTTIGHKGVGRLFNIETDMIGKYVEQFLNRARDADRTPAPDAGRGVDMELLARSGFLDR
jgi:riboflavin synthase